MFHSYKTETFHNITKFVIAINSKWQRINLSLDTSWRLTSLIKFASFDFIIIPPNDNAVLTLFTSFKDALLFALWTKLWPASFINLDTQASVHPLFPTYFYLIRVLLFTNKDYLSLIWLLLLEGLEPSSVVQSQIRALHVLLVAASSFIAKYCQAAQAYQSAFLKSLMLICFPQSTHFIYYGLRGKPII